MFVRRADGDDDLPRAIDGDRCTGGFVVGPMVDAIVAANADGRYDLSSFRGRRGNAAFDAWVQADDSAVGAATPGGYGQTEVMGMATFNLLGAERTRYARTPVTARDRCASSIPKTTSSRPARSARSSCAGPR